MNNINEEWENHLIEWYETAIKRRNNKDHLRSKSYSGTFMTIRVGPEGDFYMENTGIYCDSETTAVAKGDYLFKFPGFNYTNDELKNALRLKLKELSSKIKEEKLKEDFV